MAVDKENEHRALALTPSGRDARATCEILGNAGIAVTICADMADLCREIELGAGVVLLTSDALVPEGAVAALAAALRSQPKWSDLPVLLLASGGANSAIALRALEALPNVLMLDRPVHLPTLVSAARTALRSRKRQYQIRDHLEEQARNEKQRETTIRFLRLVSEKDSTRDTIRAAVEFFSELSGCEAVGVRLKDGDDYPYFESRGFSEAFLARENHLCAYDSRGTVIRDSSGDPQLECMCGNIICGRFDPARPFFSIGGSFWTNSTTQLLAATTDTDRLARTRNHCHAAGYESLALIPLHVGSNRLGVLHLADRRQGMFSEAAVRYCEELASSLAVMLAKLTAEEEVRQTAHEKSLILDNVNAAIAYHDAEHRLIWANAAYLRTAGLSAAELKGRRCHACWGLDRPCVGCPVATAIETGEAHEGELTPENQPHWPPDQGSWLVRAVPIKDRSGKVIGAIELAHDITARKQHEEAMRQRAEEIETLLEVVPAAVWVAQDPQCLKITGNRRANEFYEARAGENVSASTAPEVRRFFSSDGRELAAEELPMQLAVATNQDVRDAELLVERPSGRRMAILGSAAPLRDPAGQVRGGIAAFMEITDRRNMEDALRESEARFRAIFESSSDCILVWDREYNYVYANQSAIDHVGATPDKVIGKNMRDGLGHLPDFMQLWMSRVDRAFATGQPFRVEDTADFGGQLIHSESQVCPIRDATGQIFAVGVVYRDITERKRMEEVLKEDDRRKDEFLATLGHELRNPLAAITTGLRLLRSADAERHAWVKESLERQTRQLVGLVDDLLDISRITRGKIQLRSEVVDLAEMAEGAAESAADLIAEKRHAFSISRSAMRLPVLGDPTRLQQIIANLLNNAAKYTGDGGRIDLTLTREGREAVVCVKDNGMGIPADMQESIFELFGQVDSATHRPQQGLGIGLSLVKMLVELHGGTVTVCSEGEGKGSAFTVRLPAVEWPKGRDDRSEGVEAVDEELFDVLVVEDNREAARMLGAIMADKGHTVRLAENGLTAVELAAERQPDLVVLDIGLPDITGYQVAEKLRHELGYEGTLIIAATGYGQEQDRQRSRQAGIDHHLVKPVQYETLALLAREWRRTARGRRQIARPFPPVDRADDRAGRNVKILVIDDTRVIARITQQLLQQQGHTVEVAFDGPSGIEAARSFRPELILCDLSLPRASGFEVLSAIKADPALHGVMVAAMTGYAEAEDKQRTKQAGFDAHLVKPVSLEQLQTLIRELSHQL